ncbi:MAG: TIR domain-containing protein [Bradyrhizobium sp.]|nr:TIR domain-containing protein [Bradyrhizobium sp.]
MRVNVVRNAWKITHPDNALVRSFYDSGLRESRKFEGDEALRRLIREGVCNTSAACVLAGSGTWERRWVRYEIARAIIDGRGHLTVPPQRHQAPCHEARAGTELAPLHGDR